MSHPALPTRAPACARPQPLWPCAPWPFPRLQPRGPEATSPGLQPPEVPARGSGSAPQSGALAQTPGSRKGTGHESWDPVVAQGGPRWQPAPWLMVSWSLRGGPGPAEDRLPTSSVFLSGDPNQWLFRHLPSTYPVPPALLGLGFCSPPPPCPGEMNIRPPGYCEAACTSTCLWLTGEAQPGEAACLNPKPR